MSIVELRTEDKSKENTPWKKFSEKAKAYECLVLLCPEDEGGFSVHALTLPGAVSQGETEQEALDNIREAIEAAIEEYKARGVPIPWESVEIDEIPKAAREKWILVNA